MEDLVEQAPPLAPIEEVNPLNKSQSSVKVVLDDEHIDPTSLAKEPEPVKEAAPVVEEKPAPKAKEKAAPAAGSPRAKIAALLASGPLTADLALKLNAIKRAAKKGWDKLGVNADTEKKIKDLLPK